MSEDAQRETSSDLVFLTSAGNNNEAAILRGYLEHHGIYAYVQGEQHRSMLGMVGAYIELRVMVPAAELETAQQLLELFHSEQEQSEQGPEFRGTYRDETPADEDRYDEEVIDHARLANEVRRARLIGLVFPFGGGHFAAGAPIRGLFLSALGITGLVLAVTGSAALISLWMLAVVFDLLSVRGPLFEREVRRARGATKRERDGRAQRGD